MYTYFTNNASLYGLQLLVKAFIKDFLFCWIKMFQVTDLELQLLVFLIV